MSKELKPEIHVRLDEDGFFYMEFVRPAHVNEATARYGLEIAQGLFKGRKRLSIVEISAVSYMDKEARDLFSGPSTVPHIQAMALVANNPVSRVIGNFFIGINRPSFPVKLFESTTEAKKWLKNL